EPNRQRVIGSQLVARSRAEIISMGFDQRLDRLSLQTRAVREMLKLDKAHTLEMFQRIPWPELRRRQCRDALIDHVDEYYRLLGEIAESSFTADERRRGRHIELLSYRINQMRSPVEVGPAVRMLLSVTLTDDELTPLVNQLTASLDRIESDDRSFSASFGAAEEEINRFVKALAARNVSSVVIAAAYRRYLIKDLAGNRCADSGGDEFASSVRDSFNKNYASDTDTNRAPIGRDDIGPAKMEGQADFEPFVNGSEFERAWQGFLDLLLGKGHGPLLAKGTKTLPDEQKNKPEWQTQFDEFLHQVDELKPITGEPEYKIFYRKATILQGALRVAPPGPERDRVIGLFVSFLRSSNLQQENVLEWYAQLQRTASVVRGLGPAANARFLDDLESSGHPILGLFALATKVVPEHE
ncbi:MAG TPA: hypothetical protein VGV35_06540, partial [Bryobacteraceae bacterium]|nr:hypothetical protein [Bryobacteraceae bacterium]